MSEKNSEPITKPVATAGVIVFQLLCALLPIVVILFSL
jgi:hypothetical protein